MRVAVVVLIASCVCCGGEDTSGTSSDTTASADQAPVNPLQSSDADQRRAPQGATFNPAAHYNETGVLPSAVDWSVTRANDQHLAYYPPSPIGKLVVFLPGTGGAPGHEESFMAAAADQGFHGIDLSYPTDTAAEGACGDDLDCYKFYQAEMFTGTDYTDVIQTLPQDSIHQRLLGLVQFLTSYRPRQDWDQFLNWDGDLYWPNIVFAGLSQGGGHAAWAGVNHNLSGVLMFSSVVDSNRDVSPAIPATWVTEGHKTPASLYYGFDHDQDYVRAGVDVNWPALGMSVYGGRTPTDGVAAPYGGSHELSTAIPAPDGKYAHGMVVTDGHTPTEADGTPVYYPVWSYMLGALR